MIRIAHSRSQIRILTFYPSRIPDPGVKKAPDLDPQYYPKLMYQFRGIDALKSLKIRAHALTPVTQMHTVKKGSRVSRLQPGCH
jgi:hypothetical protein